MGLMMGKCEICYQNIDSGDDRRLCGSCGNDYHRRCIEISLMTQNKCPNCKNVLVKKKYFNKPSLEIQQIPHDKIKWWKLFIIFEIFIIILSGRDLLRFDIFFLYTITNFIIFSFVGLLISRYLSSKINNFFS